VDLLKFIMFWRLQIRTIMP